MYFDLPYAQACSKVRTHGVQADQLCPKVPQHLALERAADDDHQRLDDVPPLVYLLRLVSSTVCCPDCCSVSTKAAVALTSLASMRLSLLIAFCPRPMSSALPGWWPWCSTGNCTSTISGLLRMQVTFSCHGQPSLAVDFGLAVMSCDEALVACPQPNKAEKSTRWRPPSAPSAWAPA